MLKVDCRAGGKIAVRVFNQKIDMQSAMSERDLSKWADLVRTYISEGGMQVTYMAVDAETLKEAQKKPAEYGDLWVRVGGYSALFTDLSKELQDTIIARELMSV